MRKKILTLIFALALLPRACIYAADNAALTDIRAELEKIRAAHKLPALAAAVIVDGKLAACDAVGVRKMGDATAVTAADQFHLGSCTKAFTGMLAAMFVQAGKLKWDSTLAGVFPELADNMHPSMQAVTLEQLLAHRSGLAADTQGASTPFQLEKDADKLALTLPGKRLKLLALLTHEKPAGVPGTAFVYANCNFTLAAAMLERASGDAWEHLVSTRIFQPLEMTSAGFGPMGLPGRIEQPWQHFFKDGKAVPLNPLPSSDNPPIMNPAGRIHCSLEDWAKFVLEILRAEKGRSKLIDAQTFKRMFAPIEKGSYACGWNLAQRGWSKATVLNHNGTNTQNYAVAWLAPAEGFAVLVATNQGGGTSDKACDEVAAAMIKKFLK